MKIPLPVSLKFIPFLLLTFGTADVLEAARGRVHIEQNGSWNYSTNSYEDQADGSTVMTDQGTLLRATTFWCITFHSWGVNFAKDFNNWLRIQSNGFNCVRLSLHNWDPDLYNDPVYYTKEEWLNQIDQWVDWAEELGLYVILDHHEAGGHTQAWLLDFWASAAPRYRHRTHVLYEIANEPVAWRPSNYTAQDMADQQELYDLIRESAPQTHVIVLSFAIPDSGMNQLAAQMDVDWSITSVGFHGYWSSSAQNINELKKEYPVINTEFTSPTSSFAGSNPPYYLDGYAWQQELMEKMRISWAIWNANHNSGGVANTFTPMMQHAEDNNYLWQADNYDLVGTPDIHLRGWLWLSHNNWTYSPEFGWLYYLPTWNSIWIYSSESDFWIERSKNAS